jgi:hypothetical protein
MKFDVGTLKSYVKKTSGMIVDKMDKIGKENIVGDTIEVSSDFRLSYFMDSKHSPGYDRFNIKQILVVVDINYSELLKFARIEKLKNIN